MPAVREKVQAVHHLELAAKNRRYTFRVLADEVAIQRWEGGICRHSRRLSTDRARRLYAWLVKLGYTRF